MQSAEEFLKGYECSRLPYKEMFEGKDIKKVEVKLCMDHPQFASFHFTRGSKIDISTVTF